MGDVKEERPDEPSDEPPDEPPDDTSDDPPDGPPDEPPDGDDGDDEHEDGDLAIDDAAELHEMADALGPLILRRSMPLESMTEAELLKLHRQFNHPSDDKLQALLKRAGVPDAIVAKAAGIASKCPSTRCHVRQAIRRPVTGFPKASRFRELLIFDVFTISHGHDARIIRSDPSETYSVLGCIDWATRWQKCYIIPD